MYTVPTCLLHYFTRYSSLNSLHKLDGCYMIWFNSKTIMWKEDVQITKIDVFLRNCPTIMHVCLGAFHTKLLFAYIKKNFLIEMLRNDIDWCCAYGMTYICLSINTFSGATQSYILCCFEVACIRLQILTNTLEKLRKFLLFFAKTGP